MLKIFKAIATFFTGIGGWFKNLSPGWKKFLSYIGVFFLGVAITLSIAAYAYAGIRADSREYANRVNKLITELTSENKHLGETISGLELSNKKSEGIIVSLRNSEREQRQIIAGLSADYTKLDELARKLTSRTAELVRVNGELTEENKRFREGNLDLVATNKRFGETIAAFERIIRESTGEHSELRKDIERALDILRRIQEQN